VVVKHLGDTPLYLMGDSCEKGSMQVDTLGSDRTVSLDDLPLAVHQEFKETRGNATSLTDLAS
jgi:hypothetical protein